MIDLPAPLAVICHDAGAANIIFAWITERPREALRPVIAGPAADIWRQRFGSPPPALGVEEALQGAAAVLTGTGWASDLEHRARKIAREVGIRSVAVIDHWVNYRERFVRGGKTVLPDEIWVADDCALELARTEFPNTPVRLKPNLYLLEQVARTPPLEEADIDVLFVAEPARSDWGRGTPGEFQALNYFLMRRQAAGVPLSAPVRIRPHPSEPPGKYDHWAERGGGITIDSSNDVASALAGVRWVVGCESYALVIALTAGRTAISALPPWAPPCRLPHAGILRMAEL